MWSADGIIGYLREGSKVLIDKDLVLVTDLRLVPILNVLMHRDFPNIAVAEICKSVYTRL